MFIHSGNGIGPDPDKTYPVHNSENVIYLKNIITRANILVGDYTTFCPLREDNKDFEKANVLYHYELLGDKLVIGKFTQVASKVIFLMNGACHTCCNFSTYGFGFFGNGWQSNAPDKRLRNAGFPEDHQIKGDTIVGNSVWLGYESLILPGVTIGDGAIIGARTVVSKDVPPYSIVAGNPGQVIKMRFDEETIQLLLKLKWWDLPVEIITQHLEIISGNNKEKLFDFARKYIE